MAHHLGTTASAYSTTPLGQLQIIKIHIHIQLTHLLNIILSLGSVSGRTKYANVAINSSVRNEVFLEILLLINHECQQ